MELETGNGNSGSWDRSPAFEAADPIRALVPQWSAVAKQLRYRGAEEGLARAYEVCAHELELALASRDNRLLSISEAAALTGRHRDTIGKAVAKGSLTNHGGGNRPRLLYAEVVALFPQQSVARADGISYDGSVDARAFLGARRGETT